MIFPLEFVKARQPLGKLNNELYGEDCDFCDVMEPDRTIVLNVYTRHLHIREETLVNYTNLKTAEHCNKNSSRFGTYINASELLVRWVFKLVLEVNQAVNKFLLFRTDWLDAVDGHWECFDHIIASATVSCTVAGVHLCETELKRETMLDSVQREYTSSNSRVVVKGRDAHLSLFVHFDDIRRTIRGGVGLVLVLLGLLLFPLDCTLVFRYNACEKHED